jgi:hypothetical protein
VSEETFFGENGPLTEDGNGIEQVNGSASLAAGNESGIAEQHDPSERHEQHEQHGQGEPTERHEPHEQGEADARRRASSSDASRLVRRSARRKERVSTAGGSTLHLLVLSSTREDTTVVDLATRTVMRIRVPWPEDHEPDISTFDVVEVTLAPDPERDDLAQPEATTVADLPRHVGTLRGRHVRKLLRRMVAAPEGPLLGFPGASAPYWEFRGFRPSVALIEPTRNPQLIRRSGEGTTWVRFGWGRDDVWLPVEDANAIRALVAARRERLSGKSLANALGFEPQYLLVTVSPPRDGHCYKVCAAVLPSG